MYEDHLYYDNMKLMFEWRGNRDYWNTLHLEGVIKFYFMLEF